MWLKLKGKIHRFFLIKKITQLSQISADNINEAFEKSMALPIFKTTGLPITVAGHAPQGDEAIPPASPHPIENLTSKFKCNGCI